MIPSLGSIDTIVAPFTRIRGNICSPAFLICVMKVCFANSRPRQGAAEFFDASDHQS